MGEELEPWEKLLLIRLGNMRAAIEGEAAEKRQREARTKANGRPDKD